MGVLFTTKCGQRHGAPPLPPTRRHVFRPLPPCCAVENTLVSLVAGTAVSADGRARSVCFGVRPASYAVRLSVAKHPEHARPVCEGVFRELLRHTMRHQHVLPTDHAKVGLRSAFWSCASMPSWRSLGYPGATQGGCRASFTRTAGGC
jgi:hypothetical protein